MGDKLKKLIDLLKQLVVCKRTGCLRINFSQGGITDVRFDEKIL